MDFNGQEREWQNAPGEIAQVQTNVAPDINEIKTEKETAKEMPAQGSAPYGDPRGFEGNTLHSQAFDPHTFDPRTFAPSMMPPAAPAPQKTGKGARVVWAVASLLICAAVCFGAGVLGSFLWLETSGTDGKVGQPDGQVPVSDEVSTPSDEASTPSDGVGEVPSGSSDGQGTSSTAQTPRPSMPSIEKPTASSSVGYSGSAGDNAYSTLAEAVDQVNETVVEIFTETIVSGGWLGNYVSSGAGSGVIISEDGYIVTNNHVIEGASTIQVRLVDGTTFKAQLIGADAATDLAVLLVTSDEPLPAARFGCSADLIVGESVFAIGNPLGSLGGTVTDGIISATERTIRVDGVDMTLLQTNAAVNPGNSGGGLFNMAGQLVGVVNAKSSADDVEGLGFAIPVDTAYEVICQLIEYGYVRGVVDSGLDLYDVSSSNIMAAVRYFGMSHSGVYVLDSAYSEDILFGDLLLKVGETSVSTAQEAEDAFDSHAIGDTVTLTVVRLVAELQDGREYYVETTLTVELTLQEYVPDDIGIRFESEQ